MRTSWAHDSSGLRGAAKGARYSFCAARAVPQSTILAGVKGAYNAVWVKGQFGADTFYYGRGAGRSDGVAVVSDLMRVAREIRSGSPERCRPLRMSVWGV